jgi:hypothetical protein
MTIPYHHEVPRSRRDRQQIRPVSLRPRNHPPHPSSQPSEKNNEDHSPVYTTRKSPQPQPSDNNRSSFQTTQARLRAIRAWLLHDPRGGDLSAIITLIGLQQRRPHLCQRPHPPVHRPTKGAWRKKGTPNSGHTYSFG